MGGLVCRSERLLTDKEIIEYRPVGYGNSRVGSTIENRICPAGINGMLASLPSLVVFGVLLADAAADAKTAQERVVPFQ